MLAPLRLGDMTLDWSRPYVVGVVNVTPDSFSDGGRFAARDAAVAHGLALAAAGADLVDVGGESTRPGAVAVSAAEEVDRVAPVIEALTRAGILTSVDTTKAQVAIAALAAGAVMVNDVAGGLFDPGTAVAAAAAGAGFVCGHLRGRDLAAVHAPDATSPAFTEVVADLGERLAALPRALVGRVIVDPGLGFGKRLRDNLELCRRAGELSDRLSCPVMVGPSRKRFLGELTGAPVTDRDAATVGAALAAVAAGAHLVRVHDVARLVPALTVFQAVNAARAGSA